MIARRGLFRQTIVVLLFVIFAMLLSFQCSADRPSSALQRKYKLSDKEWADWKRFHVDDADSVVTRFWGLLGEGDFDGALDMVKDIADGRMAQVFRNRVEKLWLPVVNWPAAPMTEENQIALGKSETIGFRTWGQLWSGGFQRAVFCGDSITAYFVFSGYWQTDSIPLYAAVMCGDFGVEVPQWQPFPNIIFSIDSSEEAIKAFGAPQRTRTLDEFLAYLRRRTFNSMGR